MANSINNYKDVLAKEKNIAGMAAAPVACTMDYNPVCCNVRGDHTTESNNCNCVEAKQGVKLYDGECKKEDTNPNPTNLVSSPPGTSTRVVVDKRNVDIIKDEKGKFKIKSGDKEAESDLEISEQDLKVVVKTSSGTAELKVLPDQAAAKGLKVEEVKSMKLVEEKGNPVYDISGKKRGRLFALIPVSGDVEQKVDAQSGEIIYTKTPWWSFLATGI
jgi:uncharacterized membrane protein YkoI